MNSTFKTRLPLFPVMLLSLLIAAVGVGCGGGGGSAPPPPPADEDARGIYSGTGAGTFTGINANAEVTLSTVKGMVGPDERTSATDDIRFIFFNADMTDTNSNVLYDGKITLITKTDLVGAADVYQGGEIIASDVAVTGTVVSRSRVQLTLAASGGFLGGSVDANFDSLYDRDATDARIDSQPNEEWGSGGGLEDVYMVIPDMTGSLVMRDFNDTYRFVTDNDIFAATKTCVHNGTVTIPNASINVYTLSDSITLGAACTSVGGTTGYTGFATVVDMVNTDDTMWYAVTNGTYSVFAILNR